MKTSLIPVLGLVALALGSDRSLPAQAAASRSFFLPAREQAAGGSCQSARHVLSATLGSGVVAERAISTRYVLEGGFVASLDSPVTGRPWLAAVTPLMATMRSGAPLELRGTELLVGAPQVLKIGGQVATVTARTRDALQTSLPSQPAPGWQRVELQSTVGTSVLPRGIGVLPLLEVAPIAVGVPSQLVFRGRQGDAVVLLLALNRLPLPIPIAPLGHGLELDLTSLVVLGPLVALTPDGVVRVPVPALLSSTPIFVQAAAFTSDPGYAPGSFTIAVRLL